jgi:hypothetical protein
MMFFAAALAKARAARSTECNITEPSAGRSDQGLPLGQLRLLLVFYQPPRNLQQRLGRRQRVGGVLSQSEAPLRRRPDLLRDHMHVCVMQSQLPASGPARITFVVRSALQHVGAGAC